MYNIIHGTLFTLLVLFLNRLVCKFFFFKSFSLLVLFLNLLRSLDVIQ